MRAFLLALLLSYSPLLLAGSLAPFAAEFRIYVNKLPTPVKADLVSTVSCNRSKSGGVCSGEVEMGGDLLDPFCPETLVELWCCRDRRGPVLIWHARVHPSE